MWKLVKGWVLLNVSIPTDRWSWAMNGVVRKWICWCTVGLISFDEDWFFVLNEILQELSERFFSVKYICTDIIWRSWYENLLCFFDNQNICDVVSFENWNFILWCWIVDVCSSSLLTKWFFFTILMTLLKYSIF